MGRINRKKNRELLMQLIFQMEAQNDDDKSFQMWLEDHTIDDDTDATNEDKKYIIGEYNKLRENIVQIDALIDKHSPKKKVDRLPKAELAILRLSVCELMYCEDIPDAVAINEAVELAKAYGTDTAPSFINGVLRSVISEK